MEKIIAELTVVIGLMCVAGWSVKSLHDGVRNELISTLKKPTPSLTNFTSKLTAPK